LISLKAATQHKLLLLNKMRRGRKSNPRIAKRITSLFHKLAEVWSGRLSFHGTHAWL